MASPFNIFDFSALGGASSIAKPPLQTPGVTGGGVMPPTISGQPALERPQVLPTQPQIGNLDNEKIKRFIDHGKSIGKSKEDIMTAYQKGIQSGAFNKMEAPKEEAGGFMQYMRGLDKRVGEGLAQIPSDIINIGAEAVGSDFRAQPITQSVFGITPSSEKGVIGRSADIIGKSGKNLGAISEQLQNQTMVESIGQGAAETLFGTANVFGEVFMAGLSTLAPDIAKEKLKTYIQEVAQSKGGEEAIMVAKQIGDKYNEFAKENPRAARNLKAITQLGSVATELYGIGKGKKVITGIGDKTGDIAQKTGEMVGKTGEVIGDIGKKTGEVVTAPFKSIINTTKKYAGTPEEVSGIQSAIKPKQRVKNGVLQRGQDQINNEIKLTNGLIRESGDAPTNLATYKDSIKKQMENVGSEINRLTGQDLTVDLTPTAGKIRQIANSREVQLLDPTESGKLLRMADDIEKNGRMKLQDAEAMNQFINDTLKSTTSSASEAYKRGLQILVGDIRQGLDDTISNIPGQFKDIKKTYGALRNVYGDTVAREIVYNRQNMGGLIDSIGAIEGSGNIISGGMKILTGSPGAGLADIGKGITQNAVGRFIKSKNDPNNIIRSIFQKGGEKRSIPDVKNKPKVIPLLPAGKPMTGYAPGKIKATSEALSGKVGERPGTVAKLEDKQGLIKQQQSLLNKDKKLQSDAQEINKLFDNVKGRGTPDVVDRLVLKMEGILGEDKISIPDTEKILKLSKTKIADDVMDRVYRKLDEKGYTINNDGFIQKAKPTIIPEAKQTQAPTIPKTIETTPTAKKIGIIPTVKSKVSTEIPEVYIRNTFTGKIEKINQSKKGSLNIGEIGKSMGLKPKSVIPDELKGLDISKNRGSSAGSMNKKLLKDKTSNDINLAKQGTKDLINKNSEFKFNQTYKSDNYSSFDIRDKESNKLLGFLQKEEIPNGIKIKNIGIDKNKQGKGIGTKIVNELKKKYSVIEGDSAGMSKGFWEKMGAKFTGEKTINGYEKFIIK